jgi:hypothetical protein
VDASVTAIAEERATANQRAAFCFGFVLLFLFFVIIIFIIIIVLLLLLLLLTYLASFRVAASFAAPAGVTDVEARYEVAKL